MGWGERGVGEGEGEGMPDGEREEGNNAIILT